MGSDWKLFSFPQTYDRYEQLPVTLSESSFNENSINHKKCFIVDGVETMKYKDKSWSALDLKVYSEMLLGLGRRQICWMLGRYKLILIGFVFSLLLWTLVGQHSDHQNMVTESSLVRKSDHPVKKVKEIPDFDYKYDAAAADKNVEYSDNGAAAHINYIQSQKIREENDNIKDSLLLSNNLEDEVPKFDLQRDSSRIKDSKKSSSKKQFQVVDRRSQNSLNGVDIHMDDSGN